MLTLYIYVSKSAVFCRPCARTRFEGWVGRETSRRVDKSSRCMVLVRTRVCVLCVRSHAFAVISAVTCAMEEYERTGSIYKTYIWVWRGYVCARASWIFCAARTHTHAHRTHTRHRSNVGAPRWSWQHDVNRPCVIFERGLDGGGSERRNCEAAQTAGARRYRTEEQRGKLRAMWANERVSE